MVSQRARDIYAKSQAAFTQNPNTNYSQFKIAIGGDSDPVLYSDLKAYFRAGSLNTEAVQRALA